MIAVIKHIVATLTDTTKFAVAVWIDARAMQAEAQKKYGWGGF